MMVDLTSSLVSSNPASCWRLVFRRRHSDLFGVWPHKQLSGRRGRVCKSHFVPGLSRSRAHLEVIQNPASTGLKLLNKIVRPKARGEIRDAHPAFRMVFACHSGLPDI